MNEIVRFEYDGELLASCARSGVAAAASAMEPVGSLGALPIEISLEDPCVVLFDQHSQHYGRHRIAESAQGSGTIHPIINNKRFQRFLKSLSLVHAHNSNPHNLHRLALNQFADQDDLLHVDSDVTRRLQEAWESAGKELVFAASSPSILLEEVVAANLTVGKGGTNHLNPKNGKKKSNSGVGVATSGDKLKFPNRKDDTHFAVPEIEDPSFEGDLVRIKPRRKIDEALENRSLTYTEDEFSTFLNWATTDNPDGVDIVGDTFDQGGCGSCWAFAATGSLEASVSRSQAKAAYQEYLERVEMRSAKRRIEKIHDEAVAFAQSVEQAAFQMANLSIQELVDCDTAADQGCVGGNPLLSFYFIHRYGLTSWSQYPYVGQEDECHKKWVSRPIAKVKAWGIVSPNHENHMELVLRYIGPIAVGVNAADRSFLAYQEGIFDKPRCRQAANHALLITGYGQERTEEGELVRYWIARNSWGRGWGENGWIRIKRGDGLKGTPGVCGIAASPSVALGGVLLTNRHRLAPYHHAPNSPWSDSDPLSTSHSSSPCVRLGFDSCHEMLDLIEDHRAVVLGVVGIFCATFLAVWPLSSEWRRRRRRRRRAREMRASRISGATTNNNPHERPSAPAEPAEIDPLLGDRSATRYTDEA